MTADHDRDDDGDRSRAQQELEDAATEAAPAVGRLREAILAALRGDGLIPGREGDSARSHARLAEVEFDLAALDVEELFG